jgi:hypothetical protein
MVKQNAAFIFLLFSLVLFSGCKKAPPTPSMVLSNDGTQHRSPESLPKSGVGLRTMNVPFDNGMVLVAVQAPEKVAAGSRASLKLFFEVTENVFEPELQVFIHGLVPGAELNLVGADHRPIGGRVAPGEWNPGDLLVDSFSLSVPASYPGDTLWVMGGLYAGNRRFEVKKADAHDGENRVRLATVRVEGSPVKLAEATIYKRKGKMQVDGKLDEPEWQSAEVLGPFIAYDGRSRIKNTTTARLVWDEETLWVAFECVDSDIHTPYSKRDDPLYNSEAVEIFIDADGDKDEYVELQAAPNGIRFDAAFKGGRRKNFDTSYNVNYQVKNTLDGTFNDNSDADRGWISEWAIPISELRDVPVPPAAGAQWKINLFRLDRLRRGNKVVGSEASAWSSPLSGDFHNLDRFGTIRFANAPPDAAPADGAGK